MHYNQNEIQKFVHDEIDRRVSRGISSHCALCPDSDPLAEALGPATKQGYAGAPRAASSFEAEGGDSGGDEVQIDAGEDGSAFQDFSEWDAPSF